MAESPGDSSNTISTNLDDSFSPDKLFEELRDWEDQLKDVDFDFCERAQDGDGDTQVSLSSKRGGPSPC